MSGFRRSNHIAVSVPADAVEGAVSHYKTLFGLVEKSRSDDGVELEGENFTIWVDVADGKPGVLQEFVTTEGAAAREAVGMSGGKITGESNCGFYVADPFGMTYHVYVDEES